MTQGDGISSPQKHRGLRQPWKPGESGNPAGRPKGSRNKLSEEFVAEVYADWCEHGAAAIQTVRETRPDVYVKVVASLLPRQVQAEVTGPTHEDRVADWRLSDGARVRPLDGVPVAPGLMAASVFPYVVGDFAPVDNDQT